MATKEDPRREREEDEASREEEAEAEAAARASSEEESESDKEAAKDEREKTDEKDEEEKVEKDLLEETRPAAPSQLGYRKFVYGAYFAGAIAVMFIASKIVTFAWHKLAGWKPNFGEPRDEIVMPISFVLGVLIALYYWMRTRARRLAEEVAEELSKVTWPSRKEVTNGTTVVIVATIFATVFFALMDRFWGFVTDKVYGM